MKRAMLMAFIAIAALTLLVQVAFCQSYAIAEWQTKLLPKVESQEPCNCPDDFRYVHQLEGWSIADPNLYEELGFWGYARIEERTYKDNFQKSLSASDQAWGTFYIGPDIHFDDILASKDTLLFGIAAGLETHRMQFWRGGAFLSYEIGGVWAHYPESAIEAFLQFESGGSGIWHRGTLAERFPGKFSMKLGVMEEGSDTKFGLGPRLDFLLWHINAGWAALFDNNGHTTQYIILRYNFPRDP